MKASQIFRIILLLTLLALPGTTPAAKGQVSGGEPPVANPSDVQSVDAIVSAVYDVISGPAGQARNWDRWMSLFLPEARLIAVSRPQGENAAFRYRVMSPAEYAERSGPALEAGGFFESEIGRTQEEFGPVVHLFSAYESKRSLADPEPFARGINSFQLMHDGSRWWVVTIYWTSEGPDLPIPERYLSGRGGPPRDAPVIR